MAIQRRWILPLGALAAVGLTLYPLGHLRRGHCRHTSS